MNKAQQIRGRYSYWIRSRGLSHDDALEAMVQEYVLEERERCAKIAERAIDYRVVAKAIREG